MLNTHHWVALSGLDEAKSQCCVRHRWGEDECGTEVSFQLVIIPIVKIASTALKNFSQVPAWLSALCNRLPDLNESDEFCQHHKVKNLSSAPSIWMYGHTHLSITTTTKLHLSVYLRWRKEFQLLSEVGAWIKSSLILDPYHTTPLDKSTVAE
jgi:hypothetical protein